MKKNIKIFSSLVILFSLTACTTEEINQIVSVVTHTSEFNDIIHGDNNNSVTTVEEKSDETSIVENNSEIEESKDSTSEQGHAELVDYVAQTKLDLNDTSKVYAEVSVKTYVDGDTTHFVPKGSVSNWIDDENGTLKARYISVDTPESTGKVEPWGKAASNFTHEKLADSEKIIIQSDTNTWKTDSTGGRHLVWVWYLPKDGQDYRLLNLELIQLGYAKLKSASEYSLYETFSAANLQAMNQGLGLYSNEKAPYYYYGDVQSTSIKEIRLNAKDYEAVKISVEGLITVYDAASHMAYAEQYDPEENRYFGINIFLGYSTFTPIKVGNQLRISGNLAYYAPGADDTSDIESDGTWQITGLFYNPYNPSAPESMEILSKGNEVVPTPVSADQLSATPDEQYDNMAKGDLIESTYVSMNNLTVTKVYTTESSKVTSNGALTLTCKTSDNKTVTVRTSVLKKGDGSLLTEADVLNKTISVQGIVAKFNGKYQIKVFTMNDLQIA